MKHIITNHSTKSRDLIWATCSCGWKQDPRPVRFSEEWDEVRERVESEGAAHRRLGNELDAVGMDARA
jgi:hypothetical protein